MEICKFIKSAAGERSGYSFYSIMFSFRPPILHRSNSGSQIMNPQEVHECHVNPISWWREEMLEVKRDDGKFFFIIEIECFAKHVSTSCGI